MFDLLAIEERHRMLYTAFLKKETETNRGFDGELKRLLHDLATQSRYAASDQDYLQLAELLELWKKAGPAIGIDVAHISLAPPSLEQLQISPPDQPIWTENSLMTWVLSKAS